MTHNPSQWSLSPAWLGGFGLFLALAGFLALSYSPKTAEEKKAEERLAETLDSWREREGNPPPRDDLFPGPFSWQRQGPRPYKVPGRLAFYLGMMFLAVAAVLWFRNEPPTPEEPQPEEQVEDPDQALRDEATPESP